MSLINEALKRAKQVQAQPSVPLAADPALQPVFEPASGSSSGAWLIGGAALIVLVLAGWFLSLWWRQSNLLAQTSPTLSAKSGPSPGPGPKTASTAAETQPSIATMEAATSNLVATAAAVTVPPGATRPAQTQPPIVSPGSTLVATGTGPVPGQVLSISNAAPAGIALPETKTAPVVPTVPEPELPLPELKVQGIFYRASNSSALINGHPVFVGDELEGVKIVGIERLGVRVLWSGRTNLVKLR